MKIDLYNNTETFIKESKQDSAIRKWSYKHGISVDYLMDHPCIQDVVFLLEFRDEFQKEYKTSRLYTTSYNAYWRNTYCLKKPLKPKAFKKFEIMAQHCLEIRQQQQAQLKQIQQLRQLNRDLPQQNKDHDNEAKGSDQPGVTYTKREQLGCRLSVEQ
jgi:hypothetical protein